MRSMMVGGTGGGLCLILAVVLGLTGCVNQRREVIDPGFVQAQNDQDWKIKKEPLQMQQPGPR